MAGHRTTVYVADALWSRIDEALAPDESLSSILELEIARRLKARPGCRHTRALCAECGEPLPHPGIAERSA